MYNWTGGGRNHTQNMIFPGRLSSKYMIQIPEEILTSRQDMKTVRRKSLSPNDVVTGALADIITAPWGGRPLL